LRHPQGVFLLNRATSGRIWQGGDDMTTATLARPLPLLTIRRISAVTGQPVSAIRQLLDEHPEIQPLAVADQQPVYDRDALVRLLDLIGQPVAAGGRHE